MLVEFLLHLLPILFVIGLMIVVANSMSSKRSPAAADVVVQRVDYVPTDHVFPRSMPSHGTLRA